MKTRMKTWILCFVPVLGAAQQVDANACFQARGKTDAGTIQAMSRALDDPELFTCAATNLRIAGAVDPLRNALEKSDNPQVRAAVARELGSFHKLDLLEPLSRAAEDENALVATNALAGLSQYQDAAVLPYLAALSKKGGIIGDMALDRLLQLDSAAALMVARGLLSSPQVPDRLYAMRVIGAAGDSSDLPVLRKIAAGSEESLSQRNRGFGFMPPINLARAAQSAIGAIEKR
jgi:HEAT repeat protein